MTIFAQGERYRATIEFTVVNGPDADDDLWVEYPNGNTYYVPAGQFTRIELLSPAEPPHNSVVIDCDGDAWQNDDSLWSMAGAFVTENNEGAHYEKSWTHLTETHGPVKVVFTP